MEKGIIASTALVILGLGFATGLALHYAIKALEDKPPVEKQEKPIPVKEWRI